LLAIKNFRTTDLHAEDRREIIFLICLIVSCYFYFSSGRKLFWQMSVYIYVEYINILYIIQISLNYICCSIARPTYHTLVHFIIHNNLFTITVSNFLQLPYVYFQFDFAVYAFLDRSIGKAIISKELLLSC
jgi:hypothetical protein